MSQNYKEYLKSLMKDIYDGVDRDWMMKNTVDLWKIELPQTWTAYTAAADHTEALLKAEGFDVERIVFPADGKTVYQDKRMPYAWDAGVGRLTVTKSEIEFEDPVVADYDRHPFHLMRASTSLPEGGVEAQLVSERFMREGGDCTGKIVLLDHDTPPNAPAVVPALDSGAIGFVSSFLVGGEAAPDSIQWCTAVTEGEHWHCQCEDRDYVGYSISPNMGKKLREALSLGEVWVKAESDGRRYEGEVSTVTALIPGWRKEEVWIFAHLYEPLINDNSAGVIGAIAVAKKIREMVADGRIAPLEFSIRLVFGMEYYGFCATAEHFGGNLRNKTIAAINMDGLPLGKPDIGPISIMTAPSAVPCFANYIAELLSEANCEVGVLPSEMGGVGLIDDMFLGDSTTGLPTLWPKNGKRLFWHNSFMDESFMDIEKMTNLVAYCGAWVAAVSTMNGDILPQAVEAAKSLAKSHIQKEYELETGIGNEKWRMDFWFNAESVQLQDFARVADAPEIDMAVVAVNSLKKPCDETVVTPWILDAKKIVPKRKTVGIPFDLISIPKEERKAMPDGTLYGPMAIIISNMDGKKTLAKVICEAAWEMHRDITEEQFNEYVDAVKYLAEYGYIEI